jgi:type IV pilus assembly protein PilW
MKTQQGFSLMEMLVAMALGLLVVGGVAAVLASSSTIYKSSESRARIQEGSRFSLGMLQEDVRMSGHMGCFNYDLIPNRYSSIVRDGGFDGEYANRVVGYDAKAAGGFHVNVPDHIGKTGFKPVNGSDVLVVRVPTGKTLPLSDFMQTDELPIPLGDATGLEADRMAVVSDCNYAVLFVMTNVPADKKIGHAANKNTQVSLGRTFRNDQGASVTPVSSVAYFVGPAANGVAGNKSLYRQEGSLNAEEIADGIEQMQVEYMVSPDLGSAAPTRRYVTAADIGTAPVIAVRVQLLLKSQQDNVTAAKQELQFAGALFKAGDRRMYTPFSTTISLRNQGLN